MKTIPSVNEQHGSTDVQAAIDAGVALGEQAAARDIQKVGTVPFLVSTSALCLTSLEAFADTPARVRGTVGCETPLGFTDYVKRYRDRNTIVFIRRREADMTAVFDYHQTGDTIGAGPGEHRATFKACTTPEWDRWMESNRTLMSQENFAEFIEDNLGDIGSPDGAVLLELVENFKVKKDVNFTSQIKRSNGAVKMAYVEDVTGSGGTSSGDMAIPEKIVLGIAVYEGGMKFKVEARLRYRLNGGKLALSYDILRLDDVLRNAFEEVVQGVQVQLGQPGEQAYVEGTAPSRKEMWGQ